MHALKYAARSLGRTPALVAAVVACLGIGIGGTVATFAALDRILFQAPPGVADPDLVRRVYARSRGGGSDAYSTHFSYATLRDLQRLTSGKVSLAGYELLHGLRFGEDDDRVSISFVTPGYFEVFGAGPLVGRHFRGDELLIDQPQRVALISHRLWRRSFNSDPAVIGRSVALDTTMFTIVGVMRPGFEGLDLDVVDVWAPFATRPAGTEIVSLSDRSIRFLDVILRDANHLGAARLETLLSTEYARVEGTALATVDSVRIVTAPTLFARGPVPLGARDKRNLELAKRLAGVAWVMLLVASANVASLLLMRAVRRRHELALRLAVGASHRSLVGLVAVEMLLLSAAGGLVAMLIGWWSGGLLRANVLANLRWTVEPSGHRAVILAAFLALVSGIVIAAVPAMAVVRRRSLDALKGDAFGADRSGRTMRVGLLVTQSALCIVLLSCAGIFTQSLRRAGAVDAGFESRGLITIEGAGRSLAPGAVEATLAAIRSVPGVNGAANAAFDIRPGMATTQASSDPGGAPLTVTVNYVDSAWFRVTGTKLIAGRGLGPSDRQGTDPAVVITETAARALFTRGPVGQCLFLAGGCMRVVGVVRDIRWFHDEPARAHVLLPLAQGAGEGHFFVVREDTLGPPVDMSVVAKATSILAPDGRLPSTRRVADRLSPYTRPWEAAATLFALFGALALISTAIGIYGVVNYDVSLRSRELAVRVAMGAAQRDIVATVFSSTGRALGVGITLGVLAAIGTGRLLSAFLYETSPADPLAIASATATIIVITLIACTGPARRVLRINPASVLSSE